MASPDLYDLYEDNYDIQKEQEALKLFDFFEIEKSPFYVRIFNEMPRSILEKFVERNNIDKITFL